MPTLLRNGWQSCTKLPGAWGGPAIVESGSQLYAPSKNDAGWQRRLPVSAVTRRYARRPCAWKFLDGGPRPHAATLPASRLLHVDSSAQQKDHTPSATNRSGRRSDKLAG